MILVLHAVNRSGLVMDGTRYIGAAERAEAWLFLPCRRSVQGHRRFESGRWVARNAVQKMGSLKSKKVISQKTSSSCIK